MANNKNGLKNLLNEKVKFYHNENFIAKDPISIPHQFTLQQDIEIAAFFAAILAWGNRTSIINSCNKLMGLMNNTPHHFIINHSENELKNLISFKHRTFNADDLLYFIYFLKQHFTSNESLETAFNIGLNKSDSTIENGLNNFYKYFFSFPHLDRTHKHIASPHKKSACKRLCMFLRWMVRPNTNGVDFGLWKTIETSQLIMPLDVHVARVANELKLINTDKTNWEIAVNLTNKLKEFNANDPVVYDYALFSMGVDKDI
jgi:uncharacterized protein (TIGR02757 family)